jgi:hypothetical protein
MATDEPVSMLAKGWATVSNVVHEQQNSHELGKAVPESFSPKIQRRLASTVPPKPMVELSYEDAFKTLTQMCEDCREAVRIVDFGAEHVQRLKVYLHNSLHITSTDLSKAFLWSFNSRKPEPLSYPRACLSAPLFSYDDQNFERLLRRDLEEILLPQDLILDPVNWTFEAPQNSRVVPDPRFELANTVDKFTEGSIHMVGGYIDLYRSLCSNRCRLRRNLCHVVLALEEHQSRDVRFALFATETELGKPTNSVLQTEQLDDILHNLSPNSPQFPLSTWTYYQKLQIMMWIIQLGFELDIYLPDELCGMYWYVPFTSIFILLLLT